jgi:hypothetical protein
LIDTGTVMLFTVLGSRFLLNVNTTVLFTATAVAPLAGLTETTAGAVVSATPDVPVVKLLVKGTTLFPAWSVKPDALMV